MNALRYNQNFSKSIKITLKEIVLSKSTNTKLIGKADI